MKTNHSEESLLSIEDLGFRWPQASQETLAISRLQLQQGETAFLYGPSGCGKSTTGRLVLGLEPPSAGTVLFEGQPMPAKGTATWRKSRARLQMVFQDPLGALDRRLTIGRQIAEPSVIHGQQPRVEELVDATKATAEWIWNHHPAALCGDNPALEALPVMNREFQHRRILPMFGMPIGEFWDFEELAEDCARDGVYEFFLVTKPLNLRRGVGSPPNALAFK